MGELVTTTGKEPTFTNTNLCRIKTGTYTGDGSEGQAITGVGFSPKFVKIWIHTLVAMGSPVWEKLDQTWGTRAQWYSQTPSIGGIDDAIIALGAGGFTVDDAGADTDPNKNGIIYDYLCLG